MEFMRLADVAVVETANDDDKVLIEQGGEIKRVPKTEVGGGAGNTLIFDFIIDTSTEAITIGDKNTTLTLEEVLAAINNKEITGVIAYVDMLGQGKIVDVAAVADYSQQTGANTVIIMCASSQLPVMWTADGFTMAG